MRKTADGLELTLADLVSSACRVWGVVTGSELTAGDLAGDAQDRWVRACSWARLGLASFDGKPVREAVAAFLDEWAGADLPLRKQQDAYLGEWEAVVRHLCALLDSDELDDESDVQALEQTWAAWLQRRPRRLVEAG